MKKLLVALVVFLAFWSVKAQQQDVNYDEGKVPQFKLPAVLELKNGKAVKNAKQWERKKRPETFRIFEEQVYGKTPAKLKMTSYRVVEESDQTPYPNSIRRQVEMVIEKDGLRLPVNMLIYLPKKEGKVPLFVGYNFSGNHTVSKDIEVPVGTSWVRNNASLGITNNRMTEQSRGADSESWSIDRILKSGYGLATIYYGDVDPDFDDFTNGVHPFAYKAGQSRPGVDEWGAIAAWAWGLSCALDYFETDRQIDARKVAVMGHSRLGKAALWAGARDTRFALVISNNSGCGGAALSMRRFGETVGRINSSFPHWFCDNFKAYSNNEDNLPVDQHQLIALMAPRPVYIASAQEDQWADPRGEFLSGYYATPVYQLYGLKGIESDKMPGIHQPVMNSVGYHIRAGVHDVTDYDWQQFIKFADMHLGRQD